MLLAMDLLNPYAKTLDDSAQIARAKIAQTLLASTPIAWARQFLTSYATAHGRVPAVADIAAEWRREAARRVAAVDVPAAPLEVETDPARWTAWERTRRAALVAGASGAEAQEAANAAAGVRQQIASTPVDPTVSRARLNAVLDQMTAAREDNDLL